MATLAQSLGGLVSKGVGMIPGIDLPGERRKRVMSQAFSDFEQSVANGTDVEDAQIRALSRASAGLASEGFTEAANQMRMQLVELVKANETRQLEMNKLRADTAFTKARTDALGAPPEEDAGVINMVKLDPQNPNAAPEFAAVADNNPTRVQELIDQGFLEMSAVSLGATGATLGEAVGGKPVTRETQEAVLGQLSMLSGLKVLKAGTANTGIIEGPARGIAAKFGLALPGEQGASAVDMLAVRRKMRADIQSIVKGIPSNYDAAVFEVTIPNPFQVATPALYEAQIGLLERETEALVSGTIAFHKGTNSPIPAALKLAAGSLGVDLESVRPWDGQGNPWAEAHRLESVASQLAKQATITTPEFNPMDPSVTEEEVNARIDAL